MLTTQASVTMKGKPLSLTGNEIEVGQRAPQFTAVDNDMKDASLADFSGRVLIINSVPSLDTAVCSKETHRFNEEADHLGSDIKVLTISMDLPFAQKRWCGAEGIKNVVTLSDYRDASFGQAYGVLIKELRLLARAVMVVDAGGVIRYRQLVPEITQEPNYEAALKAARDLVKK